VIETIQLGIPIARMEFLDDASIRAVNAYSTLDLPARPTLFLEFHGSEAGVRDQVESVESIVADHGGTDFEWASSTEAQSRLWKARHNAAHAVVAAHPGTIQWWTDVCVPISRLADCVLQTQTDIRETGLPGPILGHVGDGNFHVGICAAENDEKEKADAQALHHRLVERALAMGGTCTGEHGIGMGKIEFLEQELGECVDVMRTIKQAIDPTNIMNPGKVLRSGA
jgi:D-lactate dehydrogenase (cytochrome)